MINMLTFFFHILTKYSNLNIPCKLVVQWALNLMEQMFKLTIRFVRDGL